jgi:predicted AlkP superfamily pyrophosphatase or phosphodiesterase
MGAKIRLAAVLAAAIWGASAQAQTAPTAPKPPAPKLAAPKLPAPKLVVAISIDQFSTDLFAEYRAKFTGGFKRILQGAVFPSGYQSHAATETCPGHSTILTGTRPARNGIIANEWSDPASTRKGKDGKPDYTVYCAEDETVAGSNSSDYTVSAVHLKTPTLGDRLKAKNKESRVVAVAGKDRSAVMMGGHAIDQVWWWSKDGFVSFTSPAAKPPAGLAAVNGRAKAMIAKPVLPALPMQCQGHAVAVPIDGGKTVGTLTRRKEGDARGFRASSDLDLLTLDLARSITTEMKLGKGAATDVLAIGLSATDYVGHSVGTNGAEMCTHLFALDAMLGRFLTSLDAMGTPYIVVLTADHGGHDLPERNKQMAIADAERADVALLPNAVGAIVAKALDLKANPLIGNAPFGDIYVSNDVPADKRIQVRDAAMKVYREHRQVEAVIDGEFLSQLPMPTGDPDSWTIVDRARASFQAGRSGDFIVLLKPRVTPIPSSGFGYVATHGSPWNYDRRVPILFWQKGRAGFEQPNGIETVDIMPTLAALIGLTVPQGEIDGHCLDLDRGGTSTCSAN